MVVVTQARSSEGCDQLRQCREDGLCLVGNDDACE